MSVFDLRQWLADADRAGELEHVRGADAALEIGAASQLNYRRQRPRALRFDEITGYGPGQRVLTSSPCSPALLAMTLGLGAGLDDRALIMSGYRAIERSGLIQAAAPDLPREADQEHAP
jgi:3-polyprenyl-4-hydroxybenzoate decarboxylase